MPRDNLIQAREDAHLTQVELADRVGVERHAIIAWEAGTKKPQPHYRRILETVLHREGDKELFNISPSIAPDDSVTKSVKQSSLIQSCSTLESSDKLNSSELNVIQHSEVGDIIDMDKGRRHGLYVAGTLAASTLAGATLATNTQIIMGPTVQPDAYISLARMSIPTWWQWFSTGNNTELREALNQHVPVLWQLATSLGPSQKEAASLALETKIMQVQLSNHNVSDREKHCVEAVQMGALSGDRNLYALAVFWYADTFVYCHHEPDSAIPLLNSALKTVDGNPLVATRIYSDLAISHAQNHDETNALDFVEMAYSTMPSNPATDNRLYRLNELNQTISRVYLYLAEHLPNSTHAQTAYGLLDESVKQASTKGFQVQALTQRGDAARLLGEKDDCIISLTQAYEKTQGPYRLSQIQSVLSRVPSSWQSVRAVKNLKREVSNALVVARA